MSCMKKYLSKWPLIFVEHLQISIKVSSSLIFRKGLKLLFPCQLLLAYSLHTYYNLTLNFNTKLGLLPLPVDILTVVIQEWIQV